MNIIKYSVYLRVVIIASFVFVFFGINIHNSEAINNNATNKVETVIPKYTLEALPDNINYHDFVVGPGKVETTISPGQSQVIDLTVANRLGSDKVFSITEEDFKGSNDPNKSVVLLGSDIGPYSLKDDVNIPSSQIKIPFGYKASIPITITVPVDAQPGGLYGSIVVSVVSVNGSSTVDGVGASNPIVTRIGTLFFVRIPGQVDASGTFTGFSIPQGNVIWSSSISKTDPLSFDLLFKNNGNVYVNPSGTITIKNIFGATIGSLNVDPWFAMPQSLRFREVSWQPTFLFGRYTAQANINPGYGSSTETKEIVFWVIPWTIILIVFISLVILIGLIKWVFSRFSIVAKN